MKADELTALAAAWLASQYPESVIVTEFSVASWGGASIDVAAITTDEIVGIEVKGEGDSPSRLQLQGHVYSRVASRMWLLADASLEARCMKQRPEGWGRLEVFDGAVRAYNTHYRIGEKITAPDGRSYTYARHRDETEYKPDEARALVVKCPWAMCGTLWRDELYDLALRCGLSVARKAREPDIIAAITNALPAPRINAEMIRSLNLRRWRKPVQDLREGRARPADRQAALL